MSSEDEAEVFVGDEHRLQADSQVLADLTGNEEPLRDKRDSDADESMPEDDQDDAIHIFEGHTGLHAILIDPK
jgi:hypothetical protein